MLTVLISKVCHLIIVTFHCVTNKYRHVKMYVKIGSILFQVVVFHVWYHTCLPICNELIYHYPFLLTERALHPLSNRMLITSVSFIAASEWNKHIWGRHVTESKCAKIELRHFTAVLQLFINLFFRKEIVIFWFKFRKNLRSNPQHRTVQTMAWLHASVKILFEPMMAPYTTAVDPHLFSSLAPRRS